MHNIIDGINENVDYKVQIKSTCLMLQASAVSPSGDYEIVLIYLKLAACYGELIAVRGANIQAASCCGDRERERQGETQCLDLCGRRY